MPRHDDIKRGIAITPVKFGISFTATFFNQAGALVLVYRDGTVQVNHGGTEMGQGLFTKIHQIAADSLGVIPEHVRIMSTRTDKVPNTSATAASAGTDLNGAAVVDACAQLTSRLAAGRRRRCSSASRRPCDFADGQVRAGERALSFAAVCEAAYMQRVPLFAQGYYRTPEIHFDRTTGRGKPFHYFAFGAAVSEVEVERFTGDYRLLRTDILQDVGDSVSPVIDRGQIEGGFLQGVGWLTLEELLWDDRGRLATAGASTYKLPSWSEVPDIFEVSFLERATQPGVVFGSKAVGEPPLMLAISVREAIRDAVAAFGHGEFGHDEARDVRQPGNAGAGVLCRAPRARGTRRVCDERARALSSSPLSHPRRSVSRRARFRLPRRRRRSRSRGAHRVERRLRRDSVAPLPMRPSSIGEAGCCCPAWSTRTSTIPSFVSSAPSGGRSSTGSSTSRCPRRRGWPTWRTRPIPPDDSSARSRATGQRLRWCSGRILPAPPRPSSRPPQ